MRATQAGMIMGTAGYMSPEQACGQAVDKRADIWAFGVVLYEMLAGERMFRGDTAQQAIAAVLTYEPEIGRMPARVRRLLESCLEKDAKQRLRDIGDAWRLTEEIAEALPASAPVRRRSTLWVASAAALAAAAVFAGTGWWRASRTSDRPLMRLDVDLGP